MKFDVLINLFPINDHQVKKLGHSHYSHLTFVDIDFGSVLFRSAPTDDFRNGKDSIPPNIELLPFKYMELLRNRIMTDEATFLKEKEGKKRLSILVHFTKYSLSHAPVMYNPDDSLHTSTTEMNALVTRQVHIFRDCIVDIFVDMLQFYPLFMIGINALSRISLPPQTYSKGVASI